MSSGPWEQLFQDPHSWIVNRNKALRVSLVFHDMPTKYPKDLPRFNGDDAFTPEEHITTFQDYIDYLEIKHDDVFMRIFCHSLTGDVRSWFKDLAANSITSWIDFYHIFLDKWGEKKSHHYYLIEFYSMKISK
jgi:hypothetical protein